MSKTFGLLLCILTSSKVFPFNTRTCEVKLPNHDDYLEKRVLNLDERIEYLKSIPEAPISCLEDDARLCNMPSEYVDSTGGCGQCETTCPLENLHDDYTFLDCAMKCRCKCMYTNTARISTLF